MSGAIYEPTPRVFRPFGRATALHIASRSVRGLAAKKRVSKAMRLNPNWQRAAIAYNDVSGDGQRHLFTHRRSLKAGRPLANASDATKWRTNQSFNSRCSENRALRAMHAGKPTRIR